MSALVAALLALLFQPSSADHALARVDAAYDGLQHYFFQRKDGFWKACGQNGGLGHAPSRFDCVCEKGTPFCKNCYRWWMAVALQSLVSLNEAIPSGHSSLNTTRQLIDTMRQRSPYTLRAQPSWAYIDDYLWYVLMWLDVYRWLGHESDLTEAAATFDLMTRWADDTSCGGIVWMYPDTDPRKNAITTLEAMQASAQLAVAFEARGDAARARGYRKRARALWAFFDDVSLLGNESLVHDNVTGSAHGAFHCCNGHEAPICKPRGTLTWTYNQGMFLGAMADMHALTKDAHYLALGAAVLDAVVTKLAAGTAGAATAASEGGPQSGPAPPTGAALDASRVRRDAMDDDERHLLAEEPQEAAAVLHEPVALTIRSTQCDATHDPSSPAGGDLFSFKAVFMQHLPRFVQVANASGALTAAQHAAAVRLVAGSADAAWSSRILPPFPAIDICHAPSERGVGTPSGLPKFTWNWGALPTAAGEYTCLDARTQAQALSLFVAHLRMAGTT